MHDAAVANKKETTATIPFLADLASNRDRRGGGRLDSAPGLAQNRAVTGDLPPLEDSDDLRRALAAAGTDHLVLTPLPAASARVRFLGPFGGREVAWDAEFIALGTGPGGPRPFIEIAPGRGDVYLLRAGLALERMDVPAVTKAVIMVRNYRRLRVGRHVFGAHHPRDA